MRAILFGFAAMVIAWLQMAFTAGAGGTVHHAVLLWPLPELVIAVSFASAAGRLGRMEIPTIAVALVLMMASGVLVINEYYRLAWQNGGAQNWTKAITPLSEYLRDHPASKLYCMDWGILDSLRLLNRGTLPLGIAPAPDRAREVAGEPGAVFLMHAPGMEFSAADNAAFVKAAEQAGFRKRVLTTISDGFGRPVFEVYRFE